MAFPYDIVLKLISSSHKHSNKCTSHGGNGSNGENKDLKSRQEAVLTFFLCERSGKTVELSKTFRHTKFPIPLSLTDTAGVQLHHTQKSYLRSRH